MDEKEICISEQNLAQNETKKGTIKGLFRKIARKGHEIVADKAVKNRNEAYLRRLEKYSPVYMEEFESGGFYMPNILLVEDDSKRHDADVLERAIGWRTKEKGTEVFHIFEDSVSSVGLVLVPDIQCSSFYYVDGFDKKRFVRVDCIFDIARDEKLAELKHIAYCLGAKSCSVEIEEKRGGTQETKKIGSFKIAKIGESRNQQAYEQVGGKITVNFDGSDNPFKPTLKWFAYDQNVINLIEARCENANAVKSETIELYGAFSSVMSHKAACEIDSVMKAGGSGGMESKVAVENERRLRYYIEF